MSLSETIRNNRATIVCAGLIAALLAGMGAWQLTRSVSDGGRLVALVHDGDGVVHELPLDTPTQITVTTHFGSNTLTVEDGAVRMVDADCPNRTCVQTAPLSTPGPQIICLPHELWVEVVPEGSEGGELDITQAEEPETGVDLQAR